LEWIPFQDRQTFQMITKGKTAGVFQLEGGSATRGVRSLKPTKVQDIIAAMALFRPAALKTGASERFIRRKAKEEKIPERHPIMAKVTDSTQGIMIYQEQVISILRALGMEPEPLNDFLSAVKASNKNTEKAQGIISNSKTMIADLCHKAGMSKKEFDDLWYDIEGFGEYGFNQAHSTAYGITAYRCAYLACHHPIEFFAALLNVAAGNPDKEPDYIKAARDHGVKIMPANINYSGVSYEVDRKNQCIRKGLKAIHGVGEKAAAEIIDQRPSDGYASLDDFCERVSHRKVTGIKGYKTEGDTTVGTFGVLMEARALEGIE
jgi:DNA polymerase III subunit alpha